MSWFKDLFIDEAKSALSLHSDGGEGGETNGVTVDRREIYQGTRPIEWLRMPDYDKLDANTMYFLFDILPYGDNIFDILARHDGEATVEFGSCKDGVFVADAEYGQDIFAGGGATLNTYYTKVFNYDEWGKYQLSNGRRQIIIKMTFNQLAFRIGYNRENIEVKEILNNCFFRDNYFQFGFGSDRCHYHYMEVCPPTNDYPNLGHAKYTQKSEGHFTGSGGAGKNSVILKIFNQPFKNTMYWECFRECRNLEEITLDISELTQWVNPFRATCNNLKKLLFVGGENLTSFPDDINLNPCSLNVDGVREFFYTLPNIVPSGTARTITLTNSPAATTGIPEDVLQIATDKGWTVTT